MIFEPTASIRHDVIPVTLASWLRSIRARPEPLDPAAQTTPEKPGSKSSVRPVARAARSLASRSFDSGECGTRGVPDGDGRRRSPGSGPPRPSATACPKAARSMSFGRNSSCLRRARTLGPLRVDRPCEPIQLVVAGDSERRLVSRPGPTSSRHTKAARSARSAGRPDNALTGALLPGARISGSNVFSVPASDARSKLTLLPLANRDGRGRSSCGLRRAASGVRYIVSWRAYLICASVRRSLPPVGALLALIDLDAASSLSKQGLEPRVRLPRN